MTWSKSESFRRFTGLKLRVSHTRHGYDWLVCVHFMLTLKALYPYLQRIGLVLLLLLNSLRSRAISTVSPNSLMSSLICCFHVFLGHLCRLTAGGAKFVTLRATLFSSRLCTCTDHRRRPLRMITSIGGRFISRLSVHSGWTPASIPQGSHGASSSLWWQFSSCC